ncbi:MAG: hypothetical protein N0E38_00995 [Candidatus Thiodiazotropha endolucinida]|nr:hypothetical protein [Candidatus Thiodiazotropha taylori]MCW4347526.1 hypothetical protein [Candidatus Thiodiazotropha endolucinida]
MAKESRIKIDLLRLHDSDAIERELVDYLINEVSNAKRQEVIRLFIKVGYALLAKGHLPNAIPTPSHQPPVQTKAAPEPVQEVDQSPLSFSPDHQEEEMAPTHNKADESDATMDAADPLSKMKASFNK